MVLLLRLRWDKGPVMPITMSGGKMPGPSGETSSADGQMAGADMSAACQQAADASMAHCEAEAGKVAMSTGMESYAE
jgi:hypothetical protein